MAKLYLKFDAAVLKEFTLSHGVVTIGRLPDNLVQIDNPAVSGHHARIYWDTDHYVMEDNNSTNGTYVNNARVTKATLKDGDSVLVGKHTLEFKDAWHEDAPQEKTTAVTGPALPKMEGTVMLDTKKARELMAQAQAQAAAAASGKPMPAAGGAPAAAPPPPPAPAKERTGKLTIMSGKTDQSHYVLTGKLTAIGKSDMATIKLRGWFAPKLAAVINRRDNKYFIAASEKNIKVVVNSNQISGQHELSDGDVIEVAGVNATFALE